MNKLLTYLQQFRPWWSFECYAHLWLLRIASKLVQQSLCLQVAAYPGDGEWEHLASVAVSAEKQESVEKHFAPAKGSGERAAGTTAGTAPPAVRVARAVTSCRPCADAHCQIKKQKKFTEARIIIHYFTRQTLSCPFWICHIKKHFPFRIFQATFETTNI